MNLSPIQYTLDEYEITPDIHLYGKLDILIDHVDDMPFIDSFELIRVQKISEDDDVRREVIFERGRDNETIACAFMMMLSRDKKLMNDIFDDCAREGMWND
jgi:hypothetical protein